MLISSQFIMKERSLLTMVVLISFHGTALADESEIVFDIDAQDLGAALNEFALQSNKEILFVEAETTDKSATKVSGTYAPTAALDLLLADTGLDYRVNELDTVLVGVAAEQRGVSDSKNLSPAPILMAQNQTFTSQTASSQQSPWSEDESDAPLVMDEVIVTGTNIRGVQNPTTPVVSFDRQDIELTGSATIEDFFRTVPQNFGSETQFVQNSGSPLRSSLNTSAGTSLDLRGAGAGSTLILLNGRRLPTTEFGAFVDVSVLPLSVIKRVDIQTDGASATYGSDAVAGVVNFITRKDYQGVEAFARYGTVTKGSLREHQAGITAGENWGSGGGLISFEYTDKDPLLSSERDYIDITTANPVGALSAQEEKYSATLSLHQYVTNRLSLSADILHSKRDTMRDQNIGRQLTLKTRQDNWFVNGSLDFDISDRWNAGLYIDHGHTYATNRFSDDNFMEEGQRSNRLFVVEGQTSGVLLELPGGGVGFALGGLYRKEVYEAGKDGTVNNEAQREVKAVYGELLIPVIGDDNALPSVQAFDISLAGRYEDYSDFGDNFTQKIGMHWRLNGSFALRGTYSESFRAPTLFDLNGPRLVAGFPWPVSGLTVAPTPPQDPRLDPGFFSYVFLSGSNPDLQPESAKVWTGGFEFQPSAVEGLNIEGTYFRIGYADRVEFVDFFGILLDPTFLSFIELNPSSATLSDLVARTVRAPLNFLPFEVTDDNISVLGFSGPQNVSSRKISGLDLSVSYDWETKIGDFTASVDGTYLFDYIARVTDLSAPEEQVSTVYRPVDLSLRSSFSWSLEGFTAYAAVNYTDGYTDNLFGATDVPIDQWTTVNLLFSYDSGERLGSSLLRNMKVSLSVQNLFDRDPPSVDTTDGFNFDPANATPLGSLLTLRINKSF